MTMQSWSEYLRQELQARAPGPGVLDDPLDDPSHDIENALVYYLESSI